MGHRDDPLVCAGNESKMADFLKESANFQLGVVEHKENKGPVIGARLIYLGNRGKIFAFCLDLYVVLKLLADAICSSWQWNIQLYIVFR